MASGASDAGAQDAVARDADTRDAAARDAPGAADVVGPSVDAGDEPTADAGPDAAALVGCVQGCIAATSDNCPVLLLYSCLSGPCGDPASTSICGGGDGVTPPPVSTIQCAQAAFPTCPGTCQGDASCKAFVACIEQCHE